ncbi:MAG: DUF4287 domain-containing protein [Aquisalinus sp.]|nr:DUF4287 domain-containing protein [Aquisalinus sp.]
MPQSPEEMAAAMIANMKEKTGKTLEEWISISKKAGHEKHGVLVKFLKTDHGMTHGFANLVAHKTLKSDAGSATEGGEDLVATQYAGAKAGLKPIYDTLSTALMAFGPDVELAAKKSYVSARRKKQFAIIQPSTKTRLDLGINLKGQGPTDRLELSGSFNSMVSHRIRLTAESDVDDEVLKWLEQAYQAAV